MKEVLVLVAIGLLIGVPSAIGLGRFVSAQLYGIQGTDIQTALAMVLFLAAIAAGAGMIPAHRASRIDPILALRFE
jgi:ABC-type antimicrobial peptide transport system permease subunit